jgi:P4 family phage/plasmid primase-like protien
LSSSQYINKNQNIEVLLHVQNRDELNALYQKFFEEINPLDYELIETCKYTMSLPSQYYTEYGLWMKVGWALRNINNLLFILWITFSSKWENFVVSDISIHYEKWLSFNMNDSKGLTRRSIMHWSKIDNYEEYATIRRNSVEYHINESLCYSKCSDVDIAKILFEFFKDEYVCVSIGGQIWYQYSGHHWKLIEQGTSLRQHISTELRHIYRELLHKKSKQAEADYNEGKKDEADKKNKICDKIQEVYKKLGTTTDKNHIMREAQELFYDSEFLGKLDENPYLLCFNNGIFDFSENVFRDGKPEDCISKTTKNNYIDSKHFTEKQLTIADEIRVFMRQLFPLSDIHDYFWEHLASTLLGNAAVQTFNMYNGKGRNGKSIMTKLMGLVLGEYKGDVPLSLITEKRVSVGGVSPEIVKLKGIRYAVMQEPSKGQRMNEGMMKQLTSGQDVLTGRAPYMTNMIEFVPQFKLVVCCNELMEINSQDYGTWRRIRVVDFMSLFTETPVQGDVEKPYQFKEDANLDKKFLEWKEIFLSLLLDIAKKTHGKVTDCPRVLSASNEYKNNLDYISMFMDEYIVADTKGRVDKKDLNYTFNTWFSQLYGEKGCPPIKELYARFNTKYGKTLSSQPWKGIKLHKEEQSLHDENDEKEDEKEDF